MHQLHTLHRSVSSPRRAELWQAFGAGYIVGGIVGAVGGVFGDAFTAWANQATISLSGGRANTLFTVLSVAYGSSESAANYNLKYLNLGAPGAVLNPPS